MRIAALRAAVAIRHESLAETKFHVDHLLYLLHVTEDEVQAFAANMDAIPPTPNSYIE